MRWAKIRIQFHASINLGVPMQTSLMTYSFRRTVEAGDMDIFSCI